MRIIIAKGKNWLGHKEGSHLDIQETMANQLIERGVAEREKFLIRSDNNKQITNEATR